MVVCFAGSADVLVRNEREARTIYKSSGKNSARYADEDVRAPSHHGLHFINYTATDRFKMYHYQLSIVIQFGEVTRATRP